MALERVRAGPAVPRRRGEKPGGDVGGALRDKRGSGGDSQGPTALERVRAGPAVPRRRGEKPGGGAGGALRDKRGSGGDSQGPMALERVRAGPAVAPPTGGEARRGRGWERCEISAAAEGILKGRWPLSRCGQGPPCPAGGGRSPEGKARSRIERFRASGQRLLACKKTRPGQTFLRTNPDAPFEASLPQASSVALLYDANSAVRRHSQRK